MSGDYEVLLEEIIENQENLSMQIEVVSEGISLINCFIIIAFVIVLLRYSYKLLDIFF